MSLQLTLYLLLILLFLLGWLGWRVAWGADGQTAATAAIWHTFPLGLLWLSPRHQVQFANQRAHDMLQAQGGTAALLAHITPHSHSQQFTLPHSTVQGWVGRWPGSAWRLIILQDKAENKHKEQEMHHYWGGLSHELRTPLTSILAHTEVARSADVPPDVQQHSLEIVNQQAVRLVHLVNGVLDFGRLRATSPAPYTSLDLILVVEEAIAELILLAEAQGIPITFECHATHAPIWGDGDKLKQLFLNLLDNSLKYSTADQAITITLAQDGAHATVQIVDEGCGIPAPHLPRVAEPFYRAQRQIPGSGLGLAIATEIVRQHNGQFHLASHTEGPNKGTAVTVSLPIR